MGAASVLSDRLMIPNQGQVLASASRVGWYRRRGNVKGFPMGSVGRRNRGGPLEGLGFLLAGLLTLECLDLVLLILHLILFCF